MKPTRKDAYEFFHRGTIALSRVEANGIRIDTDYLDRTIESTKTEIRTLEAGLKDSKVWKEWKKRFAGKANMNSVPQLGTVLNGLGFHSSERTEKGGKEKWDESALDNVDLPFVKDYIAAKKLKRVVGTYLNGIRREVVDGLLHPSYNLAGGLDDDQKGGASSYRGSSSNPNFQNVPIRNPRMSKLIRPCFVARKGHLLAEVDFSTIEVRISACYNKDPVLIDYVKNSPPKDMHRDMACEIFLLKPEQVTKKGTRDSAKNQFVFPQFYGSFYVDCAKAMWKSMERRSHVIEGSTRLVKDHLAEKGITERGLCDPDQRPRHGTFEAHLKKVEDKFWNDRFKVYTDWKRRWFTKYQNNGYFDLLTGFRCTGLYRRNQVINFPVQGCAFHCLLWSIMRLQEEIDRRGMKTKLVGQIHDCLLADVHESEVQEFLNLCKQVMTVDLVKHWSWIIVPLEIEVDLVPDGKSWLDKGQWIEKNGLWSSKT